MSPASPPEHRRPAPARRWTPARQAAFLRALKATLSVSAAAESVRMGRQSAYKLRRKLAGQPFDRAWEMALVDLDLARALAPDPGSRRCPVCGMTPRGTAL